MTGSAAFHAISYPKLAPHTLYKELELFLSFDSAFMSLRVVFCTEIKQNLFEVK
jgi:hypothetical protein